MRCAAQACERAKTDPATKPVVFTDAAFLKPLPDGVPPQFAAEVRDYFLRNARFSAVALKPRTPDARAEVELQAQQAFSAPTTAGSDHVFMVVEEQDADTIIREIDARLRTLLATAGAADTSEIPGATAAPPTARTREILKQVLEMLGEGMHAMPGAREG